MQLDIQCTDDCADGDLAAYTRRRLRFGLTRHGAFVRQVQVRLGREPAGDWSCRIRVVLLDGAAPAETENHGPDAHAAIDLAVDRSARLVGRRFSRPRPAGVQAVGPAPSVAARRPRQRRAAVDNPAQQHAHGKL